MAITGNKKEVSTSTGYKKSYGIMAYEIIGVNLSYAELKEAGFYVKEEDLEKEREFVSEREGVKVCQIEFACKTFKEMPYGNYKKFTFWLEDKNARNSEEKERALFKFINDQGRTSWSLTPNDYKPINDAFASYFTGEDDSLSPRPAKVGEDEFMQFMRSCMAIDFKNGGTIKYNLKKFFNGNFKDLKDDLKTEFKTPIIVATTIKVSPSDEGVKEIESFYKYAFAPASNYKLLVNKKQWTAQEVDKIREVMENNKGKRGKERTYISALEEMMVKMSDPDYPCKDLYHLGIPVEYKSENHIEASDSAIIQEEDDSYTPGSSSDY